MTVPVIYVKNEDKINWFGEWTRMQARRLHDVVDEKVVKRLKNRVVKFTEKINLKKLE